MKVDKTVLCGNKTRLLQKIEVAVVQLLASGREFDPQNEPRYHRHDLAVSGTLNTIIYSLTLLDIQVSSLKKILQLNINSCNNWNGDIFIYPKYICLQF